MLLVRGSPWTGRFLLCFVLFLAGVYAQGFPVDSSPYVYLIFLSCPCKLVRVGFLILYGRRAVGSRPEGLRLMAFSMVPGRKGDGGLSLP